MNENDKSVVNESAVEAKAASDNTAEKDYQANFVPRVHLIGRSSMVIGLVLAFLPIIYFYFICGYQLPVSNYVSVIITITSMALGMWLSEQLSYWPILGSASLYMSCLSGNLSGMRFPVALSVQTSMNADINTPRGQVITIVGVSASVFMNLVVLFAIVLMGGWLVSVLPASVLAAFSYVTASLVGCMFVMRFAYQEGGFAKSLMGNAHFFILAIIWRLVITYLLPQLASYGNAIAVASAVLLAYILFRRKSSGAAQI